MNVVTDIPAGVDAMRAGECDVRARRVTSETERLFQTIAARHPRRFTAGVDEGADGAPTACRLLWLERERQVEVVRYGTSLTCHVIEGQRLLPVAAGQASEAVVDVFMARLVRLLEREASEEI